MITKQDLENKGLTLIPVSEVDIEYDPNENTGYDLTVENDYTFSTYDGVFVQDTMAVYHPISNESQEEVKTKMMNPKTGTNSTSVNFEISKEMGVGLYILTKNYPIQNSPVRVTDDDIENLKDPETTVVYKGKTTSAGKAIFNSCLPDDYGFIDTLVGKKEANKLAKDIIEKYDEKTANKSISDMKNYAFKFSTISSPSITLDDIQIPPSIMEMKQKLEGATAEEAANLLDQMLEMLKDHLLDTGLYDLVVSGSAKGWGQVVQLLIAKGVIADTEGNLLEPIKAAYSDGLTPTEYFKASAGARSGIVSRVHNTADTGYLSRKLAYLLAPVEANPSVKDCKTKNTLALTLTKDIMDRLTGRYIIDQEGKLKEFDKEEFSEGDIINLRSPIFCETYRVCQTCYGKLLKRHQTPYVGILASQVLGERNTQLILRVFHVGGTAQISKRKMLQDIVENDPQSGLKIGEE